MSGGQLSEIVGGKEGNDMLLRVALSRETIFGLVAGKSLVLCFQMGFEEVVKPGQRRTFSEDVSGGSNSSSGSFEFPILVGPS